MLVEKLKHLRVILASGSPRRQQLLNEMGIAFTLFKNTVDEDYPLHLQGEAIPSYLAKKKAEALLNRLKPNDILITADTVVWHKGSSLEKPAGKTEAQAMLKALSGDWHEVFTSVCITHAGKHQVVSDITRVKFASLGQEEINFYIDQYKPFDKAGGYGIQEWLGLVGIEEISGSYTNVVGLPTQKLYKTLMDMVVPPA
ncbi:Maf family nucleotide pyrophosphatase [Lentiprolixibacter aurantiacus]|uniref:dTTP/UTP pyrophosphatase n=1 Tax=Lentiprolixibacter aurantiacus TaxID=2993939 RepID=A0AAE3MM82_9FLAO|nr:Maf family nucleotide pyrophosphatase [Lentiprolixibacter aurantiacus]MCX2719783.1 Maf family nucleotide pyrophosphatase [Lentiprolixibacter aurantiacus]